MNYIASEKYQTMLEGLGEEHDLLAQYGMVDEDEGEGFEEFDQDQNDDEIRDFLKKEKINPKQKFMTISFTGMSDKKDDEKAYMGWFKERGIKPIDIAINDKNRLNIRVKTEDMDSIVNSVKLEGTPDVHIIKVYIPNVKQEKVVIDDGEGDSESKEKSDKPKPKKVEVEGNEDDEFEITEG